MAQTIKNQPATQETQVPFLRWEDALEKGMATHPSTLAWKIPCSEEPGRLQSRGSQRVGHNWATSLSLFTSCIGKGDGNPLQCSCLENPRDGRAWWAAVYGVAQSRTRLKWLSSSSRDFVWCLSCLNELRIEQNEFRRQLIWLLVSASDKGNDRSYLLIGFPQEVYLSYTSPTLKLTLKGLFILQ